MRNHYIGDFSRVNAGSELAHVSPLRALLSESDVTVLLCRPDQEELLRSNFAAFDTTIQVMSPMPSVREVLNSLESHVSALRAAQNDGESIRVFSYHGPVMSLPARAASTSNRPIEIRHWRDLDPFSRERSAAGQLPSLSSWPTTLMSESEALDVLRKALTDVRPATNRATAVRQSDIRNLIAVIDPRLGKENPAARVPGLISRLVRMAQRSGVVGLDESDGVNPLIWLVDGHAPEAGEAPGADTPAPAPSAVAPTSTERLSQVFNSTLRDKGLGPYPDARWLVLEKMEHIVAKSGSRLTARELVAQATKEVRASSLEHSWCKNYSWKRVRAFVLRLLGMTPALRDEQGELFLASGRTVLKKVSAFSSDWMHAVEGLLIREIIREHDDVTCDRHEEIAGAIYMRHTEETHRRIDRAVSKLLEDGAIDEVACPTSFTPVYRLTETGPVRGISLPRDLGEIGAIDHQRTALEPQPRFDVSGGPSAVHEPPHAVNRLEGDSGAAGEHDPGGASA
jgi:hypothetical protein